MKTMQRPITDNVGRPTGQTESVPVMANVQAPVDVRGIKQQLQPVYDSMQWMPASDRASSAGYQAVSNILKGPDFIPAQAAEQGRSGLLTMARVDNPNLRNASQGMAAGIVPDLTEGIDAAVAKLGPDNLAALQKGRATHASKMDVADLADKLRDEPVQAFNQLTWSQRHRHRLPAQVQEQAPDVMPQVGRAYIQKLFDTATKEGGFSHSQTHYRVSGTTSGRKPRSSCIRTRSCAAPWINFSSARRWWRQCKPFGHGPNADERAGTGMAARDALWCWPSHG